MAKASTLVDNFHSFNGGLWPGASSGASAVGWRGRVTMPGTVGPTEKWSTEPSRYDLTSSYFGVELAQLPTSTAAVGVHAIFSLSPEYRIVIGREAGNLLMRKVENGVVSDTTLTYDPVLYRWVRLAHDGTNMLWQTSTNGSTWTTRRTATTTVTLSSVFFTLEGTWQTTVGTGRLEFANVNTLPANALAYTPPAYHFGTLRTINDTLTDKADDEYAGGDRVGMYEVFWDRAEGAANGTFSGAYATQVAGETATIRGTGLKLTLGLGLGAPPTWTNTITNYRYVNESGTNGPTNELNYCFNQLVRDEAEDYFDWINTNIGFTNCWAVRIAIGSSELLYPSSGLWGYDLNAKGTAGNLPATVAVSPYPTWTPGTGTATQAAEWMEWYLDALADSAAWQMRYIRDTYGYTGWFEILTPGSGTRPTLLATEVAARFTGYSATTGVGAVWHKVYQKLAEKTGVVVYCSSMADNSGSNDVPVGTDTLVGITSSTADSWSAYRWLVRIASELSMPNSGENPGRGALADSYYQDNTSTGMMAKLLAQTVGGNALATYWAHSDQLWGGSTQTFANWSTRITALNTTGPGVPPNPGAASEVDQGEPVIPLPTASAAGYISGPVLSVRLRTSLRDVHVTDQISELSFGSTSPGGYAECTISLHRPLAFQPYEVRQFGRLYVYDGRTGGIVWEGVLQDPGRTADTGGEVYQIAAVGGQSHLQDRNLPYVIIDRSLERLEPRQFSTEHPKGEKRVDEDSAGNPSLWLTAPTGTSWALNKTATMVYPHLRLAGMKLGAYSVSGDCGKATAGSWKWQTVTRSPAGVGTVDRNVDFTTAGISGSVREVGDSFPDGDDQLELRLQQNGAATLTGDDATWCIFAFFTVTAKLMTKAGVERGSAYNYNNSYVVANEVVEDLLGRALPEIDGANAAVAQGTYHIDQLAYPDTTTPDQVLRDLIALEPAYTYHVWESNPDSADRFKFEWTIWPTTVRYEADVIDGFSAPASGNTIFNKVLVRYRDSRGYPRSVTRTQSVATLTAAGIDRIACLDLGSEVGTSAAAIQVGDQFLVEHRNPFNAGRLTLTEPVLDLLTGRMVQPYEVRSGYLIRVRGVESYPDSLNPDGRDGLTVFKIAAMSYSMTETAATLDLDSYAPSVARALATLARRYPRIRRR